MRMNFWAILGGQHGDEGKAKVVSFALQTWGNVCCRFNGSSNAGHTVWVGNNKFVTHIAPVGLIFPEKVRVNLIGALCFVDPIQLKKECLELEGLTGASTRGRLFVMKQTHLTLPIHRQLDTGENAKKIGTTGSGVGPTAMTKGARVGVTAEMMYGFGIRELSEHLQESVAPRLNIPKKGLHTGLTEFMDAMEWMKKNVTLVDADFFSNPPNEVSRRMNGEAWNVVVEGAQGFLLDPVHGDYPYVTSTGCTTPYIYPSLGLSPKEKIKVTLVVKAYHTRVGEGPLPTEINDEALSDKYREIGNEFGATTGRKRRIGWLNTRQLMEAVRVNGADEICLTRVDTIGQFDTVEALIGPNGGRTAIYQPWGRKVDGLRGDLKSLNGEIPTELFQFVRDIQQEVGCPITMLSTGPDCDDIVYLEKGLTRPFRLETRPA